MDGLVVAGTGFEVLAQGVRLGPRRLIEAPDLEFLAGVEARYVRAVESGAGDETFAGLGGELSGWLEGDGGQLTGLLEGSGRPLVFEVAGPRVPSAAGWALLRAPWELLAAPNSWGLLAADGLARFSVARRLGTAGEAPGLDGWRLGLAFMASAPRDAVELDFEAEEAAILAAVGNARVDLLVEDTGDPRELARRLADAGGMPVVHLSCHGLNAGPGGVPVLLMEDETGAGMPVTAGELAPRLLPGGVRLVFVSACLTATGPDARGHLPPGDDHKGEHAPAAGVGMVAHSLASALVAAGVPAVIGWDGSVSDSAATLFAARLYQSLAEQEDVAVAVGDARRALLDSRDPHLREDWHLARLWLGPAGGGPVVAGNRKRSLIPAGHGTKTFLDAKKQAVPVASAEMFVGRRLALQQALRALRSGERAGVLLHGQGRLGKSSLAARIADRLPGYDLAVVFGDYSPLGILDAIKKASQANPHARQLLDSRLADVRQDPGAIGAVLADLLAGPCAQPSQDGRQRPLLLVIDDLEQILVPDPDGPHHLTPDAAPALAAVLAAFDPARTDSRLIITSRYTFTLNGLQDRLEHVQLAPMSGVARAKLQRRQQALASPERLEERAGLSDRAVAVSGGNPGLQDLILLRIVYGKEVGTERAEAAVAGMEAYLRQGDLPGDADVRAILENLALDTLLAEAGTANIALLRAATLFDLPVPQPVIGTLATEIGGSPARLRGLGLLDPHPDLYHPANAALAANPLAAGRIDPLTLAEQAALAAITAGPLLQAWGGPDPEARRQTSLDLLLTQLALLADDPAVTAASAAGAVAALRDGPAVRALQLGQAAIAQLDRHAHQVPLLLLRRAAAAAFTSGDGKAGDALLDRAAAQAEGDSGQDDDPLDRARVIFEQARRLITRGDLDQAGQLLALAHELFTSAGSDGEAAAVMGEIADIAYLQGDYDEALRIRREVELPAYERLRDIRETAVAWGRIADIAYRRGDYDEALRIRQEVELPAYERLGDIRETAVTWGKIADIAYERGDYDEALRIRQEVELPVFERLGDTWETAVTWGKIADIAHERGDYDEALRIRHDIELPVFERLGDTRETAVTWGKIAHVAYDRGDLEEAAELHRRRLEVNRQLGDLDGIAAASFDLARVDLAREDHQSALPRLIESFQINRGLRRPDGIAATGWLLGQLLAAAGHHSEARQVLADAFAAATKIGQDDLARQIQDLLDDIPGQSEAT